MKVVLVIFIFMFYVIPFLKCLLMVFVEGDTPLYLFIAPFPVINWLVFMDDAGDH